MFYYIEYSAAPELTSQNMRRDTACLLIGRLWVGGLGAYSWVGILRLLLSRATRSLLRELASRFGSFDWELLFRGKHAIIAIMIYFNIWD